MAALQNVAFWSASDRSARPLPVPMVSDFGLLRHLQGIVNLNPQIPDGALQLGMPEQQLDGSEILRPPVNQRRLCAAQRVGAVFPRIQLDPSYPRFYDPRILCRVEMCGDRVKRLGNRNWPGLSAPWRSRPRPVSRVWSVNSNFTGCPVFCCMTVARKTVFPPCATSRTWSLTRSQPRSLLSSEIEQGEVPGPLCQLQAYTDRANLSQLQWWLRTYQRALVPRGAGLSDVYAV